MFCRSGCSCSMCIRPCSDEIINGPKDLPDYDEVMEEAALKSAMNHGTPDISGGLEIDEDNEVVYFKDQYSKTSMIMPLKEFLKFHKSSEILNCKLGLYKVHWESGGYSLAAIGNMYNGDRWLAPVNWTAEVGKNPGCLLKDKVNEIKRLEYLEIE